MNESRLIIGLILLGLLATQAKSQESKVVRDLGLWTGVEVEKDIKNWTFSLKQEMRLKTNISEMNNYFSQVGIRYNISRNFALASKYRFTRDKKSDGSYENQSRYNLDLRYRGRLDFMTIDYRLRYQKEVESMRLFDMQEPYEKYVRNRITFRYTDLRKLEPYISGEIFQLFRLYQFPKFQYYRVEAGLRYEPGNVGQFRIAWGFNREINATDPATIYMFRVNYTYSF